MEIDMMAATKQAAQAQIRTIEIAENWFFEKWYENFFSLIRSGLPKDFFTLPSEETTFGTVISSNFIKQLFTDVWKQGIDKS